MGVGVIGLDGDGPGYQIRGLVVFADGLDEGSEQAQRVRIVRFDGQDSPVDFLGLEQAPDTVPVRLADSERP